MTPPRSWSRRPRRLGNEANVTQQQAAAQTIVSAAWAADFMARNLRAPTQASFQPDEVAIAKWLSRWASARALATLGRAGDAAYVARELDKLTRALRSRGVLANLEQVEERLGALGLAGRAMIRMGEVMAIAREAIRDQASPDNTGSVIALCDQDGIRGGSTLEVLGVGKRAGAGVDWLCDLLWGELCSEFSGLAEKPRDGIYELATASGWRLRWAGKKGCGFLAMEAMQLDAGEAWEAFAVRVDGGELRTGWRRPDGRTEAPEAWARMACSVELQRDIQVRAEPTFLNLVATMCSANAVHTSNWDLRRQSALEEDVAHWKSLATRQAEALRRMHTALASKEGSQASDVEVEVQREWRLEDIEEWAAENADRIKIMPRAIAETKKSQYWKPGLVYDALEMLASTYPMVKKSELPREDLFDHAKRIGVWISGSPEPGRAGGSKSEKFFVNVWGRRRFLEMHLGCGTARDDRFCFRCYFVYDEESGMVIVGSMPGHLDSAIT